MAFHIVVFISPHCLRLFFLTALCCIIAARAESTAFREIAWVRHKAFDRPVSYTHLAQQTYPYPHRTLLLRDCPIHSEIGWIKRADTPLSPIAQETINLLYEYFQS